MSEARTANAEQITYWNEVSGPKWAELGDVIDAQIAPVGLVAMDAAEPGRGERVLDIGCGCGQTTVELARRVGPEGRVLGVDVSGPMLADAQRRAAEAEDASIGFVQADAQTHAFEPGAFDLAFSRFGVMFFEDPAAAFANLLSALRPGGRLVFACWQEIGRNPWMLVPAAAAAKHVEIPRPSDPTAPGPFAFADPERVGGLIGAGGFADYEATPIERKLTIGAGRGMDRIVDFLMQMGPAGAALRQAEDPEAVAAAVKASMTEVLEPYYDGDGVVMDAAAWLVSARRPG